MAESRAAGQEAEMLGVAVAPPLLLALLICACWLSPSHFFWRDEWSFMIALRDPAPAFWMEPAAGHIFPLFKLLYASMLRVFGAAPMAFHLLSLTVWWGVGVMTCRVASRLLEHREAAFLLASVLIVHPVNSTLVLWSFETCITTQMLLQLGALDVVLRETPRKSDSVLLAILVVAQNFFFASGALFPLVCLAAPQRQTRGRQVLFVALTAAFLGLQLSLASPGLRPSIFALLIGGVAYTVTTFARTCLAYEQIVGTWSLVPVLICLALVSLAIRRSGSGRFFFLVAWFVTAGAPVVAGRGVAAGAGAPLYYTSLTMLPALLLVFRALLNTPLAKTAESVARAGGALGLLAVLLLTSQRAVKTFTDRDVLNRASLDASISAGYRWRPFDDPVVDSATGMRIDAELVKAAYLHWKR